MGVTNLKADWVSGNLVFTESVSDKGVFSIGTWVSALVGSGQILSSSKTKAFEICADDGGVALTAGSYQSARSRLLITTAIATGDISINGLLGHLKVVANIASSGYLSGLRGYVEVSGASISHAAGVRGMIDVRSGATIASGFIAAAFQADSNDLGGTHTGKAAVLHIPNPVAGTWDFAMAFGSAPGGIAANTHSIDGHALSYIILVKDPAGNTGYIPVLAGVPA